MAKGVPKHAVYISGPMRGYEDFNYPAFEEAAERWREHGWFVMCPTENFEGAQDRTFAEYMRQDLRMLLAVDAIAVLPGWENSIGARIEVMVGQTLGLAFYEAQTGISISTMPRVETYIGVCENLDAAAETAPDNPGEDANEEQERTKPEIIPFGWPL